MILGICQGLTQGFAILMAQQFGAKAMEKLRGTIGTSAVLAVVSALVLTALAQLLLVPALHILKTPADIFSNTRLYLRIMYAGIPVVMLYNFLASVLRSVGDGRTPLLAMVVASLVNIVLDLLFVLVLHWGIAGAAVATVIAQACSAAFCFFRLRKIADLQLNKSHFKVNAAAALRLLGLGTPMALQNIIISVGGMIAQSVVNHTGVIFIAGYTATNKLYGILEIAATSFGYALVTYMGQNLGAGKHRRIRHGFWSAAAVSVVTSAAIATIMLLFGRPILSGFISGTPEDVKSTLDVAYQYLALMSVWLPVLYILHVCRSSLQGLGNTVLPLASGIAEFVMRVVVVLTLPGIIGSQGVFYAEVLAWLGADIILVPGYFAVIRGLEKSRQ